MDRFILLLLFITTFVLDYGSGLKCRSCSRTTSARDCPVVKECGQHEVCFSTQVISEAGFIYREVGCKDNTFCVQTTSGKRSAEGDVIVCDQCCNSTFCQSGLCGDRKYTSDRGSICYHCDDQRNSRDCDTIVECGRDSICYQSLHASPSGTLDKKTGCLLERTCNELAHSNISLGFTNGEPGQHCFNCCKGDLCNTGCTPPTAVPSSALPAGVTVTPASCVDATDVATCTLAQIVVCKNATKAANSGCAHFCGFC